MRAYAGVDPITKKRHDLVEIVPPADRDRVSPDGVIAGGESGPHARAMNPVWPAALRDAGQAAKVSFFFKQWGGPTPDAGGRMLDGRT